MVGGRAHIGSGSWLLWPIVSIPMAILLMLIDVAMTVARRFGKTKPTTCPACKSIGAARSDPRSDARIGHMLRDPVRVNIDIDTIQREKARVTAAYGQWTAHNFLLSDGLYTVHSSITGDEYRLRRVMQIIDDLAPRPARELRVLDLACLEGMYAVELARRGARVVAIEGREANIAKVACARSVLQLDSIDLIRDDVRNLSREKYGTFDVVLCLGILYHLDAPDVFVFLERVAEVCTGFSIIATHTSPDPLECRIYKGCEYWGSSVQEHAPNSSAEQRERALWKSLDNLRSFVLTEASLYNALAHAGFTSAYQCRIPPETIYEDAVPSAGLPWSTFVASAGTRTVLLSAPLMNDRPWEILPERPPAAKPVANVLGGHAAWPKPVREFARRIRRLVVRGRG